MFINLTPLALIFVAYARNKAPFSVEVQADNGDGTIRAQGTALKAGRSVVNFSQERIEEPVNGDQGIKHRWIWRRDF